MLDTTLYLQIAGTRIELAKMVMSHPSAPSRVTRHISKFCAATPELHRDYLTHARRASVTLIATMVPKSGFKPASTAYQAMALFKLSYMGKVVDRARL